MDDEFMLLGDDDVLSFDNTTFKVGQLREEIRQKFHEIAKDLLDYGRKSLHINQYSRPMNIWGGFNNVKWLCFPNEGIDCEVLMLGATSWQQGKLKIQGYLKFLPIIENFKYIEANKMIDKLRRKKINSSDLFKIKVVLEFLPESVETPTSNQLEMTAPESPLDDLRQMMNQNNL